MKQVAVKFSQKTNPQNRGFTLVELMVVIVIAAILLTIAVPSFDSVMKKNSVEALQSRIGSALSTARTEAASRNTLVTICSSINGLECDGGVGDWGHGWIVFENTADNETATGKIVIDIYEAENNYTVTTDDKEFLTFSAQGYTVDRGTTVLTICPPGGDLTYARSLTVNASGLIVKSKDGTGLTCP